MSFGMRGMGYRGDKGSQDLTYSVGVDDSGVAEGLGKVVGEAESAVNRIDGLEATVDLKADARQLDTAIKEGERRLDAFRAKKAEAPLGADTSELDRKLDEERAKLAALEHKRTTVKIKVEYDKSQLQQAAHDMDNVEHALVRLGKRIGGTRVTMGPFSTTLAGASAAIGVLLPLIVSLGGAVTALAGSLGQGLAGALSVSAGLMGGFALVAGGVFAAVKPLVTQFGAARTALNAYNVAVAGYGKNSTQAATAQGKLKGQLQLMGPAARDVWMQYQKLTSTFQSSTGGIRQSFLGDISSGLRTAQQLLPDFAKRATSAFSTASQGFHQWMQGLRSPEAKGIMDNLMSNFQKALPGIMDGLGQFATAFARIASVGSDFLQGFVKGFDSVGKEFANSTSNANNLHNTMQGLVSQTHAWFSLLGSTGHLLTTIFNGGADSGKSMVKDLTHTFDQWNAHLRTAAGQNSMAQFFDQSKTMTEDLASSLGQLLKLFFNLSEVFAPITRQVTQFIGSIAKLVNWIGHFPAMGQALAVFGDAVAVAFVGNKVLGFTRAMFGAGSAVQKFLRWIGILGPATAAEDAALAGNTAALEANTAAMLENAAAAEGDAVAMDTLAASAGAAGAAEGLAAVEGAAAGAGAAVAGAGTAAEAASLSLGAVAGITFGGVLAGAVAWKLALDQDADAARRMNEAVKTLHTNQQAFDRVTSGVTRPGPPSQSGLQNAEAQVAATREGAAANRDYAQSVGQLEAAHKRAAAAQQEYNQAVRQHGRYSLQAAEALQKLTQANDEVTRGSARQSAALDRVRGSYDSLIKSARDNVAALRTTRKGMEAYGKDSERYIEANHNLQAAERELSTQLDTRRGALINANRAFQGTESLSRSAAQQVGAFARAFKGIPSVQKFLVQTNSAQATQKVAQVGNKLDDLGKHDAVVKIMADSKGANDTFQNLNKKLHEVESRKYTAKLGADASDAVSNATNAGHVMDSVTGKTRKAKIEADASSAVSNATNAGHAMDTAARGPYNANINVTTNAASAAGAAIGAMNSVPDVVNKAINVVTHLFTVHSGSGPATGGEIGSYNSKAVYGGSGKVSTPGTIPIGEEAPMHPEYVIATNPAYRENNVSYLAQAAQSLGYGIVKGFAEGGVLGKPRHKPLGPPNPKPRGSLYDREHNVIDALTNKYELDRRRHDDDTNAGRTPTVTFDILIGDKQAIIKEERKLRDTINHMLHHDKKELNSLPGQIKHKNKQIGNKRDAIVQLNKEITKAESRVSHAENPKKGKPNKSQVKQAKDHLNHLQKKANKAAADLQKLQNKQQNMEQKQTTLKQNYPTLYNEWLRTVPNDISGLNQDIQELRDEKNGLGTGSTGGGGTTPGAEQSMSNTERYALLQQFGGNFTANMAAFGAAGDRFGTGDGFTSGVGVVGGPGSAVASAMAAQAAAAAASPPAAAQPVSGGSAPVVQKTTDNRSTTTVHNHYAAPPPDPHTWSRSLKYELGAA